MNSSCLLGHDLTAKSKIVVIDIGSWNRTHFLLDSLLPLWIRPENMMLVI